MNWYYFGTLSLGKFALQLAYIWGFFYLKLFAAVRTCVAPNECRCPYGYGGYSCQTRNNFFFIPFLNNRLE